MAFPRIVPYSPLLTAEPGSGIASSVPFYVRANNLDPNFPAVQQYMWVYDDHVVFTLGAEEPVPHERAYLRDKYGNYLVDSLLQNLYAYNFVGVELKYLVTNGGADQLISGGAYLFTIA